MMMMCSLSHRQRHLEDLATDIEKFHVLVQQLSDHKAALLKKVQGNSTILKEKEEKLEKKEVRLSQLHDLIVHQEYSMEDIHNLECDKANLEEKIRQVGKAKESKENPSNANSRLNEQLLPIVVMVACFLLVKIILQTCASTGMLSKEVNVRLRV